MQRREVLGLYVDGGVHINNAHEALFRNVHNKAEAFGQEVVGSGQGVCIIL